MPQFTIIPAIDIKDGRCVRLRQGRASDETVYGEDPVQMAAYWEKEGATWLHVVDLDGAFSGHPVHTDLILKIAKAVKIPVQAGGGLRTLPQIQQLLEAGINRVILGTRAALDIENLAKLIDKLKSGLAIGIDAREGRVQIKGWTETIQENPVALASKISHQGVQTIIYTDTAADGMLGGPNLPAISAVCAEVKCNVIAAGGISSKKQVLALRQLGANNLTGAIVGKALYEKKVSLTDLQSAVDS